MSSEIELKLRVKPAQARRVAVHEAVAGAPMRRLRLFNTYYDTPDYALRKRGIALRLRRIGRNDWVITVKGGASGGGGLARRSEWEAPTTPGVFDFSMIGDEPLRSFLEGQLLRLRAMFTTDFTRTAWTIERPEGVVEVALDRGKISAQRAEGETVAEPLCEMELELVHGTSPDVLFELASEFASSMHLHPEPLSKAERGDLLASGTVPPPVRSSVSPINKEMSPIDAFRHVALSCLVHLQRNEAGVLGNVNPEFVHQARVAIRRLRSAFQLFAPILQTSFVEVFASRWKALAGQLGGARDLDVFLLETLAPLEAAFPENPDLQMLRARAEEARVAALAAARQALDRRDYSELLLSFTAALFRSEPTAIGRFEKDAQFRVRKFARMRLDQRFTAVERLIDRKGQGSDRQRHALRIAIKKLRYALDFFAPVLSGKRLGPYQGALARLQERLGVLNDQVIAARLIREIHVEDKPDKLLTGWLAGRTQLLIRSLNDDLGTLQKLRRPW